MRVISLLGAIAISPTLLTLVNGAPAEHLESISKAKPSLLSLSHNHTSHGTTESYSSSTGSQLAEQGIFTLLEPCLGSDCKGDPLSGVFEAATRTVTPVRDPMSYAETATFQGLPTSYPSRGKEVPAEEMKSVTTIIQGMPPAAGSDHDAYSHTDEPDSWHTTHEQHEVETPIARVRPVWTVPAVVLCRVGKTKYCTSKTTHVKRDIAATATRTASVTETLFCQSSPSHTCRTLKPDTRLNTTVPYPLANKPSGSSYSVDWSDWSGLATTDNAAKSSFWKSFESLMSKETITRPSHSFPLKPTANGSSNKAFASVQNKDVLTYSLDPKTVTKVSVVPPATSKPPSFGTKSKHSEANLAREEETPKPKSHKREQTTSHTKHSQSVVELENSQSWLTHTPGEPMYTTVKPDVVARHMSGSYSVEHFRPDDTLSAKQPSLSKAGSVTKWAQSQPTLANTKPMTWSSHSHLTSPKTGAWTEPTGSARYPHPMSFDTKTKAIAGRDVDTASCNPSWWGVLPAGVSFTPCAQTTTTASVGNSGIVPPFIADSLSAWKHSASNSSFVSAYVTSNLISFTGTATHHSHKHTSATHSACTKASSHSTSVLTHSSASTSKSGYGPLETVLQPRIVCAGSNCGVLKCGPGNVPDETYYCGGIYANCCPQAYPYLKYENFQLRCVMAGKKERPLPQGVVGCRQNNGWRGPESGFYNGCMRDTTWPNCPPA